LTFNAPAGAGYTSMNAYAGTYPQTGFAICSTYNSPYGLFIGSRQPTQGVLPASGNTAVTFYPIDGFVPLGNSSFRWLSLYACQGNFINPTNTQIPLIVQAASGQSVDLFQLQNVSTTVLYGNDKLGRPYTANTTPTIAANTGAGTSPTISISGTDVNGTISLTTGTLPSASASACTVTFSAAWGTAPKTVILTPANANAAALSGLTMVYVSSIGTTTFVVSAGATALAPATAYQWYYQVLG
jgi:hypothetical protein